jgi:peroxiredoxin
MRKIYLFAFLFLLSLASNGQNPTEILQNSYLKCQSVQNGYYEMTKYMKYMTSKDTVKTSFNCYFKKLENDSLYSSAFHYKHFFNNAYAGEIMYTGNDFITSNSGDSSGTIMNKSKWAEQIQAYRHNYTFFSPLTNRKSAPLQHDSDFVDSQNIYKFISSENLNGTSCYHVRVNLPCEYDSLSQMNYIRIEYNYWISIYDSLPIQYTIEYDIAEAVDTSYQYEKFILTKYELNSLSDESQLTRKSIPSFYKLKDYVPYVRPELLPENSLAPDWDLISLNDEAVSLNNLRGQLVLIDFFYKSCQPCMLAMPKIQALHEKFKDSGLKVIGIDPFDKDKDDLSAFLKKRGVSYTILLSERSLASKYNVSGYPTLYLIDRTGKIVFSQSGYSEEMEVVLEELIKKNL